MSAKLELENENTKAYEESLTLERNQDGSVLIDIFVDRNTNHGRWFEPTLVDQAEYTLSKEQVAQVIEFLSQSEEK